jgi:hypothetical protein
MKKLFLLILVCALPIISYAADTVIEGFESGNPLGWASTSDPPQSLNATNVAPVIPSTSGPNRATEGTKTGLFSTTWTSGGTGSNGYISGGTTTFWSTRLNCASYTAGINIPNASLLRADVYNNTSDPIQFALYVGDNGGAGGLERGPFMTLAAGANTYEWDMTAGCTGILWSGNGTLDGSGSKLRGIVIYTETQPINAAFSMDVDNIRIVGAQSDLTPPAPPHILSVSQGSAAGKLLVKWAVNSESDMKEYNIKMSDDAHFTNNRFNSTFTTILATITHPTTQAEVTVPTTGAVYIEVTAVDKATPVNNESGPSQVLGASLNPSGAAGQVLVVLDNKRYNSITTTSDYTVQGYYHMIVYNAQALEDNGYYFASCTAPAIENGTVTLTPASDKVVIWSTARDGETGTERSVSAGSITPLTTYINAGGRIMLSGTGIGKDMVTAGNATAFYNNVLMANLVNGAIASNAITGDDIFASVGTFYTGDNMWDYAAFAITATTATNESISAQSGATAVMAYGAGGHAAVYHGNKVVLLGFGFESVRNVSGLTGGTFAASRLVRQNLLAPIINYLMTPAPLNVKTWNIYE